MKEENSPLVSIVTPVFNGGKYLDECIRSVLSQSYRNWEHIILNNFSTDDTLEIAQQYAAKDNRIRVHNTDRLLPIMENWNLSMGLISPHSKYCKVVHADDLLFSGCIEKMVSVALSHPTVGIVGAYGLWGDRIVSKGIPEDIQFLSGKALCRMTLLDQVNPFWSPSSLLIRSDLIRKRAEYYNVYHLHSDVKACYETLKESDFGFVHQTLTYIRKHEDSVTTTIASPNNRQILDNLDHLLKFGPIFLSRSEYNRQLTLKTKQYYRFLGNCLFQLRDRKFWEFHKNYLDEIGMGIQYSRLIYTALRNTIVRPSDSFALIANTAKKLL
jgi:glycosyltransferase involved in cell wall biosynthesis